ncbi:fused MFS/spermidine synthase [Halobacteriovorax sp. GB3]|uniref:fused MFS/spermidine synthase n=1 Tax=Halobacteriovorax sp. GB3 TaxID=2719615 RepID=UPI00235F8C84|nr:fused MFS/spermidine synthase [Halobacteriovorax sp. GB3]MDD0854690.1 fused MFS/spermidine synthase [Halobacteriovorax sp. GB3]
MYLRLCYAVIFITGACSLSYQMIWQRYLNLMLGSEARSSTIIVGVFLLGLALGYYLFGKVAKKYKERHELLKMYGFVELFTGLYAVLFPKAFMAVFESSITSTNNFFVHLLISSVFLIVPTILMGATIPCMTSIIPGSKNDVGEDHALIYGVNTLGAFIGTLICSFYFIPEFGYDLSLTIFGGINILVSIFYIFNQLDGVTNVQRERMIHESRYSKKSLYVLGAVAGLVTLSIETLYFRIFSLTMGSSFLVFPIIVSIFVLGIGLGSLSLKEQNEKHFWRDITLAGILSYFSFVAAPFLPLILSNVRVSLISNSFTYISFHIFAYSVFLVVLFPAVFFMGRILPYAYSFLPKDKDSFGYDVGLLYLFNTLGCFVGSILFGYLFFYLFNIDTIFKILLTFLFLVSIWVLKQGDRNKLVVLVLLMALITPFTPFSRKHHELGLFRVKSPDTKHYKNIFSETMSKREGRETLYLNDGPNTTVSVMKNSFGKSIVVNGKSDGHTQFDFTTVSLLTILPYFKLKSENLKSAIIGIGTGMTAGITSQLERVKTIDVVEISDAIIEAQKFLKEENNDFLNSPKVNLSKLDAFQFFKNAPHKYDYIVSEPSNPWVLGVENLYTGYFYKLIKKSMTKEGILVQWAHTYSMNEKIINSIIINLQNNFNYVEIYETADGDICFLSSDYKHDGYAPVANSYEQTLLDRMALKNPENLELLQALTAKETAFLAKIKPDIGHEITTPKISFQNHYSFWSGEDYKVKEFLSPYIARSLNHDSFKNRFLDILKNVDCSKYTDIEASENAYCKVGYKNYAVLLDGYLGPNDVFAYSVLRKNKFIDRNLEYLNSKTEEAIRTKNKKLYIDVFLEYIKEAMFVEAQSMLSRLSIFETTDEEKIRLNGVYKQHYSSYQILKPYL